MSFTSTSLAATAMLPHLENVLTALATEKTDLGTWQQGSRPAMPNWMASKLASNAKINALFGVLLSSDLSGVSGPMGSSMQDWESIKTKADAWPIPPSAIGGLIEIAVKTVLDAKIMSQHQMMQAFDEFTAGSASFQAYSAKAGQLLDKSVLACEELRASLRTSELEEEVKRKVQAAVYSLFVRTMLDDIAIRSERLQIEARNPQ